MASLARTVCASLLACVATCAAAQQLSYDGRRWYDVEVSIFSNAVPTGAYSEIPVARKLTATYLPRLRELQSRSSAFLIDFPADRPPLLSPALPTEPEVPPVLMGPIYSPAVRDSFKIADFARDPFIDLDARAAQFTAMNRSIDGAPDHRLLWHKVWRQPIAARAQTPAVFVGGGDLRVDHYELEGSLRLVDNAGGVMLDINVWLNEFLAGALPAGEEWKIPALPFPPETPQGVVPAAPPALAAVWQLAQTRELAAGQIYYLDHPAVGVLIQIRPYVLPEPLPTDPTGDF